jgi:hypothetical protein
MHHFLLICIGALLAVGGLVLFRAPSPSAWVSLCNATFSLVVTLSLVLNLLSQLCPPSGKELSLIPAYVLLCIPRMSPSGRALMVQCCLTLLLLCIFCAPHVKAHSPG